MTFRIGDFHVGKSLVKTGEAPAIIIVGSIVGQKYLDLDADTAWKLAVAGYAVWKGIMNFIKNKWRLKKKTL